MKKKVLTSGLLCLLLFVGGFFWWKYDTNQKLLIENLRQSVVLQSFAPTHQGVGVIGISSLSKTAKPEDIYVIYWKGSGEVHATLWLEGRLIELGIVSANVTQPSNP